jgi:hypothetical protein
MKHKTDLEALKAKLDIIALAESYGFEFKQPSGARYRAVKNLLRDEKTSSLDFFSDTQKFYDRGTAEGGDVIDLIAKMENLNPTQAIIRAKELAGEDTYSVTKRETKPIKKKVKKIDFNQLKKQATQELNAVKKLNPCLEFVEEDKDGNIVRHELVINKNYAKLFEGLSFTVGLKQKFDYIFTHLLGWSDFWQSPTLILKDLDGRVVDIVAYRPHDKNTGQEISGMKYYYKNFHGRGDRFIYPYQKEVERIAKREGYIIIGEGLKNALNALIYGVPFVTIESTGNVLKLSDRLKNTILSYTAKGWGVATAFDGDEAGQKAYESFLSLLSFEVDNILDFTSKKDFVEYLKAD